MAAAARLLLTSTLALATSGATCGSMNGQVSAFVLSASPWRRCLGRPPGLGKHMSRAGKPRLQHRSLTESLQAQLPSASVPNKDRFSKGRKWNGFPVRDTAVLHPHSDLAQVHWQRIMDPGDVVVDATCGNGHDTLFLAKALLAAGGGTLIACDIQQYAIDKAQSWFDSQLKVSVMKDAADRWTCEQPNDFGSTSSVTILWKTQSHLDLMLECEPESIKLVVFNLGYLPGGDKSIVTIPDVTLKTISASQTALEKGGSISITCYPGHQEGIEEEEFILAHAYALPCEEWSCYYHQWINQRNKRTGKPAPSLVMVQKL